mmetsp:Transcript_29193/g.94098  ORF Transcript_29193/g.94098 Transcript_29193/m.94098 type:complete len:305 (+) Transcript_29193:1718-2632(+)
MPALAMEMDCCSIASRSAWCSLVDILSNSSMQQHPWSPITSAPASSAKSPVTGSLTTVTVSPDDDVVLPHTYTPRGASAATAVSIWLLPIPGSPTTSTWTSDRLPTGVRSPGSPVRGRPPTMPSSSPALTTSCPKMDGQTELTNSSNRFSDDAMSRMAWSCIMLRPRPVSPCADGGSPAGGLGPNPPSPAWDPVELLAMLPWERCDARVFRTEMASMYNRNMQRGLLVEGAKRPLLPSAIVSIDLTMPTTSSTSPGTQQSMSPSESSTSICRGTRPYELLSASYSLLPPGASWILTFCQSRVAE